MLQPGHQSAEYFGVAAARRLCEGVELQVGETNLEALAGAAEVAIDTEAVVQGVRTARAIQQALQQSPQAPTASARAPPRLHPVALALRHEICERLGIRMIPPDLGRSPGSRTVGIEATSTAAQAVINELVREKPWVELALLHQLPYQQTDPPGRAELAVQPLLPFNFHHALLDYRLQEITLLSTTPLLPTPSFPPPEHPLLPVGPWRQPDLSQLMRRRPCSLCC